MIQIIKIHCAQNGMQMVNVSNALHSLFLIKKEYVFKLIHYAKVLMCERRDVQHVIQDMSYLMQAVKFKLRKNKKIGLCIIHYVQFGKIKNVKNVLQNLI